MDLNQEVRIRLGDLHEIVRDALGITGALEHMPVRLLYEMTRYWPGYQNDMHGITETEKLIHLLENQFGMGRILGLLDRLKAKDDSGVIWVEAQK